MRLILTCEHAVATVPEEYAELFAGAPHILETHQGHDIGAQSVCRSLENLAEATFYGGCSRLLIDLNRSLRHPRLFSTFSHHLSRNEKEQIVAEWYAPFRQAVLRAVSDILGRGDQLLHLSIHSFTPELNGVVRNNDVGILYDPQRQNEKLFARRLANLLRELRPQLQIRMNHPYRGISDGHTTSLRRHVHNNDYLGIELEFNQRLLADKRSRDDVKRMLARSCKRCLYGQ